MEQTDIYKSQLADAAIEVGEEPVIDFGNNKMRVPLDSMKELKKKGTPSDIMSCNSLCFIKNGKTAEETLEIIQTGLKGGYHISVTFEVPEGKTLDISTPEKAPIWDRIVQEVSGARV